MIATGPSAIEDSGSVFKSSSHRLSRQSFCKHSLDLKSLRTARKHRLGLLAALFIAHGKAWCRCPRKKGRGGKEGRSTIAWSLCPTALSELRPLALKPRLQQSKAIPAASAAGGVMEHRSHHTGACAAQLMVTGMGSSSTTP